MDPLALHLIIAIAVALAVAGSLQLAYGWLGYRRFRRFPDRSAVDLPPVTILKPLHGDEPLLEEALVSFCSQDYPEYQIVFGLQDPADPARLVVQRLQARFPALDILLVVNSVSHGVNRKISNLINMYPLARHDVLLIADSDMHAAPDYLRRVVETLSQPEVGLVTTLYSGLPATSSLPASLGAAQINHAFMPGALLGRQLGREDCLGATMALTREMLEQVGGLWSLADHLADDAVLGRLVTKRGYSIGLAPTLPATTVAETRLGTLFSHELRWGRTVRLVAPVGYVLSAIQYPLFWGALALALSGGEHWAMCLFAAVWTLRVLVSRGMDQSLNLGRATPFWLLPLRDVLSVLVMLASYAGSEVAWRGHVLTTSRQTILHPAPATLAPGKG